MKRNLFYFCLVLPSFFCAACSSDSVVENTQPEAQKITGSLSLQATLPATRVTTTADNGLTTLWEGAGLDNLSVYHDFQVNGVAQGISSSPYTFTSTSVSGADGTFAYNYTGTDKYLFSPVKRLYAFNQISTNTSYAHTLNTTDNSFNISIAGLNNQNGTVGNLKTYDAMYGTTTSFGVNANVGYMNMNHFMSALRIDVTNDRFSSSLTQVKLSFASSDGSTSILPVSAAFVLGSDGSTVTKGTFTGTGTWTVNDISAASGTASIYLMTYPVANVNGTLKIEAFNSDGMYYGRQITLQNFSLTAGYIKSYKVSLAANTYYEWWAQNVYGYSRQASSTSFWASQPAIADVVKYLRAGVYFDPDKVWTDSYKRVHKGGLWLMKSAVIDQKVAAGSLTLDPDITNATNANINTIAVPQFNPELYHSGSPKNADGTVNDDDYFFLPAAGLKIGFDEVDLSDSYPHGYYWIKDKNGSNYCGLNFYTGVAQIFNRANTLYTLNGQDYQKGFSLWPANR